MPETICVSKKTTDPHLARLYNFVFQPLVLPGYQLRRLGKPQTVVLFSFKGNCFNPDTRKPNMHWILKHSGIWPKTEILVGTECCRYLGYILTLFKGYSHVNFDFLSNFLHMSKQKILSCLWLRIFNWNHWYPEWMDLFQAWSCWPFLLAGFPSVSEDFLFKQPEIWGYYKVTNLPLASFGSCFKQIGRKRFWSFNYIIMNGYLGDVTLYLSLGEVCYSYTSRSSWGWNPQTTELITKNDKKSTLDWILLWKAPNVPTHLWEFCRAWLQWKASIKCRCKVPW